MIERVCERERVSERECERVSEHVRHVNVCVQERRQVEGIDHHHNRVVSESEKVCVMVRKRVLESVSV